MLGLKRGTVKLVPHEEAWEREAEETIRRLRTLLGDAAADIRHVGSTAIPGIMAKPIVDIAVAAEDFDAVLSVNLKGTFLMIKALYADFMKKRAGRIINIASISGLMGNAGQANYSASKAGVIALTQAAAREAAGAGIRVNCIAPGAIDTVMNSDLTDSEKAAFADEIPMGRFGSPAEIAGVVSFLAGKDSSYLTAQVITADGGLT